MKKDIDFFIIGAQKAGSTYLYNILNLSSDIFYASRKRAPFFLNKNIDKKIMKNLLMNIFITQKSIKLLVPRLLSI